MTNIKWLWQNMNRVKWGLLLILLLLFAQTASNILMISIQKWIIDKVFIEGEYGIIPYLIVILSVCIICILVTFVLQPYIQTRLSSKVNLILSKRLLEYLHSLPITDFKKDRSGKYINHFNEDIRNFVNFFIVDLPNGIQLIIGAVILISIIFFANPSILFLSFILCFFYTYFTKKYSRQLKDVSSDIQISKSDLVIHTEEAVSSSRDIIAFDQREWERKAYDRIFSKYIKNIEREIKILNQKILISEPFRWGVNLIILGYGGWLVMKDIISLGLFIVIYQLASQLLETFQKLFDFFIGLSGKYIYVERVKDILGNAEKPTKDESINLLPKVESIELKRVNFAYEPEGKRTLNGINMKMSRGQKIALVGKSGGGKSTIIALLLKFLEPTQGDILVNGTIQLKEIKQKNWLNKISVVFQDPYILADTIKTNLLLGRNEISDLQMIDACKKAQIHDFIVSLPDGYDSFVGERGSTLSGGQKQRIIIARAILAMPDVLVLDESTSALDNETEEKIIRELGDLQPDQITIMIAHRLSTIQNADIIYVLDNGVIVESGKHDELMKNCKVYKDLIEAELL